MNISYFRSPVTIITGSGSVSEVGREASKRGATKVLIITDKVIIGAGLLSQITKPLIAEGISYDVLDEVVPEPPFENLEQMADKIKGHEYDLFIGIGGGSVLDATKVLAIMMTNSVDVRTLVGTNKVECPGIPTILVPTTSGTGSEVTCNAIFTDKHDQVKKGIVSPFLLPAVAIVDAELTFTVPPSVTAATGMDALVHAIESYTSVRANEITDGLALQAIKLISRSLRQAVYNIHDVKSREEMAMGSLMAGMSFGNAGVGAVHALAYPLGGKFKVPHGVANSMLLVYVMKYNVVANLEKFADIARAMGERVEGLSVRVAAEKAIHAMGTLSHDVGIPSSLREVGVTSADIPVMAEEASQIDRLLNNNPRFLTVKDIEQIYRDALGDSGTSG